MFLRLDNDLKLTGWRLRNNLTFTRKTGKQPKSRGVHFVTDESMLPDSQRYFAPVV